MSTERTPVAGPQDTTRQRATKACRDCEQQLPLNQFYTYQDQRRGREYTFPACKKCTMRKQVERRTARWGSAEAARKATIYKLSVEAHLALAQLQAGLCAICRRRPWDVVDHDHDTGRTRGLLCQRCNEALGAIGDNLPGVTRLLAYLTNAREVSLPAPEPLPRRARKPLHEPPPAPEVRRRRARGESLQRIADAYGVSLDTAARWVRAVRSVPET